MTTNLKDALRTIESARPMALLSNGAEDFSPDGAIDAMQTAGDVEGLEREVYLETTSDGRFAIRAIAEDGFVDTGEPLYREVAA